MTDLLTGVLVLALFAAGLRLMLFPSAQTLRWLILLFVVGLLALVVTANWQVDAERSPGRLQAVLVLLAVMLPGLLGLRRGRGEWLQQLVRGADGPPLRRPGLPATRRGPSRQTWSPGAPPTPPTAEPCMPEFADYVLQRRVGIGGMGSVYLAQRRGDGQPAALKVPQEKYLAEEKFVKRFFREAEILSQFDHPNIVRVFDYRMDGGEYYIAMEYLEGVSLEEVLQARTMSLPEALQVFRALADALRHIHLHKVVHRDLKPSNVMLLRGAWDGEQLRPGGVKLMDFGIAVGQALSRLTMTGARVGTPTYMAPEQAKGIRTDARSDLYSLGLLGYEMVTGRAAFEGSYESVVHQQVFEDPKPPNQVRRAIPSRLNDLILSMIEKDPDRRPNLDDVITALDDDILVDDAFEDADVLVLAVDDPQSTLRLLDTGGKLRQSWGSSGAVAGQTQDLALPGVPSALGRGGAGQLLVAFGQHRRLPGGLIWVLDSRGRQVRQFGRYGLGEAELLRPVGLATLGDQYYVLDAETQQVKVYGTDGRFRFRFGGLGSAEGEFRQAQTLCAGGGHLYVLDSGNHRVQRFTAQGKYVSRLAFRLERGSDDLRPLTGLVVDESGAVYLVDATAGKVRRVDADGAPSAPVALSREAGESPDALWLLATGPRGQIYAVPRGSQLLRIYSSSGDLLGMRNMYTPVQALSSLRRELAPDPLPALPPDGTPDQGLLAAGPAGLGR
ncbi:MAG: protein kinase [Deinococcus sp.]|nr:protein kinase [Deinococcus sp.]